MRDILDSDDVVSIVADYFLHNYPENTYSEQQLQESSKRQYLLIPQRPHDAREEAIKVTRELLQEWHEEDSFMKAINEYCLKEYMQFKSRIPKTIKWRIELNDALMKDILDRLEA